jgi:AbrB family looped-hinge helix DNA binding protein
MNVSTTSLLSSPEIVVTLTRKGQVTIPAAVRRLLGLQTEGKVALIVDAQANTVQLHVPRYPTVASLAGAAGKLAKPIPLKEMLDTARADALVPKIYPKRHG